MLRRVGHQIRRYLGYATPRLPATKQEARFGIPDEELYRPLFSPWFGNGPFRKYYDLAAPRTLVSPDRCFILYCLARQCLYVEGDYLECGVYKGGTAALLASLLVDAAASKRLHLFDTFAGMPDTDPGKDLHKKGDFSDTSLDSVQAFVGRSNTCCYYKGFIPDTFAGIEIRQIAFAHIDVDIYKSIIDCLTYIWPRLSRAGFIVFDDYGFPTCPGARKAVDDFFATKPVIPMCLPTGQAIVCKVSETL